MKINLLPEEVASQIAAGEVVERPASVVKELVENAIDAGATRIDIRVEGAGQRLVEVLDDGIGIQADDLPRAVARHATSKLQTAEDLFHIQTLGFRGEALASIGSVSHLTVTSRAMDADFGARIRVDGGRVLVEEKAGAAKGTLIRVEDLFFNTPARLKFLKKDLTERQQVTAFITRYALAYPKIAFHLIMEGNSDFQTSGSGDRREVLARIYGVDFARQLLEVDFVEDQQAVNGFISPISLTRSNRREITFFVNGRWIQDFALTTAMMRAYQTYLMVGRFPTAAIFIQLPAEDVDVNVHPTKAEVRFREPERVFSLMQRAVRRALLAYSPVPQFSPTIWKRTFAGSVPDEISNGGTPLLNSAGAGDLAASSGGETAGTNTMPAQRLSGDLPVLRWVGQVGATYIVAEGPDGLYLIDQHAAHERVLFERMMSRRGEIPSQRLIQPVTVTLPPDAARLLSDSQDTLNQFGIEISDFGMNSFRLTSIPAMFGSGDPAQIIRSVVEDFEEDETPLSSRLEDKIIARVCKRMAVKGGQLLNGEEQKQLLRDLELCDSPRTCPHGRPTMIHLSVELLEKQFGRRGARAL